MDYFKKKNLLLFLNNIYLIVIVTFERKENVRLGVEFSN